MKDKPRWMKSVLEAAKTEVPPLPVGRHSAKARSITKAVEKTVLAKA